MTNNPREQAIEKLMLVLEKADRDAMNIQDVYYEQAEAILDALNIEVVSKESEPQNTWLCDIDTADFEEGTATFSMPKDFKVCAGQYSISLNTTPQVYVENIGVKL